MVRTGGVRVASHLPPGLPTSPHRFGVLGWEGHLTGSCLPSLSPGWRHSCPSFSGEASRPW